MYQVFVSLEFYGRLNLFLIFFHKAFFTFHKKSVKKPYISSIYGQWFLLEVESFFNLLPLTKNQVFSKISSEALCINGLWVWSFSSYLWNFYFYSFNEKSGFQKKCPWTLYISRIRWIGVFGLKPEHAKIILF